jgi:transcriptional/translational regulatory protein YebC/TACO1
METALEAGADDVSEEGEVYEIVSPPEAYETVREALEKAGVTPTVAEVAMVPKTTVKVGAKEAERVLSLMEALEDHEDVQSVSGNMEISEELLERAS